MPPVASILTGLYERTHGYTFRTPPIRKELFANAYPTLLRSAGYRTGFVGKFGVGVSGHKSSFDIFHPIGRGPYHKKQPNGSTRHETQICGDRAIEFIEKTHRRNHSAYPSPLMHLTQKMETNVLVTATSLGPSGGRIV